MIKFFRKIRQTLLIQGNTSKYLKYAIGEIVLVVIGILIALQINNWNTQRQEDDKEQKILKILKSEFNYNKQELNKNIEKATTLKNRMDSLIYLFKIPRAEIDSNELKYLAFRTSAYSTFDPSNGALTNLISSGELNLIKNDSLRITLSKWFGEVQDVKEDEVRLISFGDTHLDPIKLEFLNYNKESTFNRNTIELLHNPKFENVIKRMLGGVGYIIENYHILGLEIDKILTLLNKEITLKND